MLVLADTERRSQKLLEGGDGRVLYQRLGRRRFQGGAAGQVDVRARALAERRVASGDEDLAVVQLEKERVPATAVATSPSIPAMPSACRDAGR